MLYNMKVSPDYGLVARVQILNITHYTIFLLHFHLYLQR